MPLIDPKRCPVCRELFTPLPRRTGVFTKTCGKDACKHTYSSIQRKGRVPVEALAGIKEKARRRIEAATREAFGVLTEREKAIYERGRANGYTEGYNVQYHREKRAC